MALIDMGHCSDHDYGGIGFGIELPQTVVSAELAEDTYLDRFECLDPRSAFAVHSLLGRLAAFDGRSGVKITVETAPIPHAGLGSTTALLLATAEAYLRVLGISLSVIGRQKLTGRGGEHLALA